MALYKQPIGIELVRRGIVTQNDVAKAIDYQKTHPNEKIGDILNDLKVCDSYQLLSAIGDILDEKTILLTSNDIKIKIEEYISVDTVKQCLAVPFEVSGGTVKVCFASVANSSQIESIRLLMLNKGLIMQRYITFKQNIENVIHTMLNASTEIDVDADVTTLIDRIIKEGMENRASDIHFEPLDTSVRVRYRIDGRLIEITSIGKEKQEQIIGRLKALSNMHQEKQEPQDRKNYSLSRL